MKKIIFAILVVFALSVSVFASDEICKGTPVVDGVLDSLYHDSYKIKLDGLNDNFYTSTASTDDGSKGDKATAYYLYDSSRLYVCVTVTDDALFSRGDAWIKKNIKELSWENDAVEARVYYEELGEPIKANQFIFQCDAKGIASINYRHMCEDAFFASTTVNPTGYTVEFSLPLSFGKKAGDEIGLSVEIDDLHEKITDLRSSVGGHKFNAYGSQHPYNNMVKLGTRSASSETKAFADTKKHWGKKYIDHMTDIGLFKGTDKGFEPDVKMTRAMFVTVLGRAYEMKYGSLGQYTKLAEYSDVDYGSWYGKYVEWATSTGIAKGIASTSFSPDTPITREDIALMLSGLWKLMNNRAQNHSNTLSFADSDQISVGARDAVAFCNRVGYVLGDENNNFRPKDSATRAEVCAIINRFMVSLIAPIY